VVAFLLSVPNVDLNVTFFHYGTTYPGEFYGCTAREIAQKHDLKGIDELFEAHEVKEKSEVEEKEITAIKLEEKKPKEKSEVEG